MAGLMLSAPAEDFFFRLRMAESISKSFRIELWRNKGEVFHNRGVCGRSLLIDLLEFVCTSLSSSFGHCWIDSWQKPLGGAEQLLEALPRIVEIICHDPNIIRSQCVDFGSKLTSFPYHLTQLFSPPWTVDGSRMLRDNLLGGVDDGEDFFEELWRVCRCNLSNQW
eukprot:TRINITY_DN200_c0_g1_i7.p1 TRINITY_DN200_c0_g1~~TRINITY_DN200_c0_g1_i7.p1  ORF type:complete len:166 (-),score=31.40 TRINITY_DN200_c0_g1_i7:372-869(-)